MRYELTAYGVNGTENKTIEADIVGHDSKLGLPILDIPMMSDEKWNKMCIEQTLYNYRTYSGMGEAPDYETALKWENEVFAPLPPEEVERRRRWETEEPYKSWREKRREGEIIRL